MNPAALERAWALQPLICPCDVHFVEYLRARNVRDRAIFHFGSGDHHLVGRANAETGANDIVAITASQREHDSYVTMVRADPVVAQRYKLMLGDIYDLRPRLLPTFDIVTLFHIAEYFVDREPFRSRLDDRGVLETLWKATTSGGSMVFYRGSSGYAAASPLINEFSDAGKIAFVENFHSLSVYQIIR